MWSKLIWSHFTDFCRHLLLSLPHGGQQWTQVSWVTIQWLFLCSSWILSVDEHVISSTPLAEILYKLGHCSVAVWACSAKVSVDLNQIRCLNFCLMWQYLPSLPQAAIAGAPCFYPAAFCCLELMARCGSWVSDLMANKSAPLVSVISGYLCPSPCFVWGFCRQWFLADAS